MPYTQVLGGPSLAAARSEDRPLTHPHAGPRRLAAAVLAALAACPLSARGEPLKPEVLRRAKRATVLVVTAHQGRAGSYVTTGTGFFVHPQGYLVTNAHVVGDSRLVRVVLHSGLPERRALTARVVKVDRAVDLALLDAKEATDAWLPLAQGADPLETASVWALGFPLGLKLAEGASGPAIAVTSGTITSIRRGRDGESSLIQTDAAVNRGDSGGPLVDASGTALGVVVSKLVGATVSGIAFGIPARRVRRFLRDLSPTAQGACDAAAAYLRNNPGDLAGADVRFKQVVIDWPGTPAAKAAARKLDQLAALRRKAARTEFGVRMAAARRKAARGDYEGAVAELRAFPEHLRNDAWSRQIEAAVKAYIEASLKDEPPAPPQD